MWSITSYDFLKLGKFALIENLLKDSDPSIRLEACRLIACVAQNYEEAQNLICNETEVMLILADIVQVDSCIDHKSKALSALRCLVENNNELINRFLDQPVNGYELLELALRSNHIDLQGKAAMLINCLMDSKKSELIDKGFISIIQQTYAKRPWHQTKYLLLQCLYELLKRSPEGVVACLKIGLPTQIRSLIASIPEEEDSAADDEIGDEVLRFIENR
ncbi:hypothetical protein GJ496_004349 [Pomphorhynchus laevis]|nr:hypothetical protein GJ496_004349 [Pomphorhynchus laevis]